MGDKTSMLQKVFAKVSTQHHLFGIRSKHFYRSRVIHSVRLCRMINMVNKMLITRMTFVFMRPLVKLATLGWVITFLRKQLLDLEDMEVIPSKTFLVVKIMEIP